MTDAEIDAWYDALPHGDAFDEALAALSAEDAAALAARNSARRGPGLETEFESPLAAGAKAFVPGAIEAGADMVPFVGQAKAVYEVATGRGILTGTDLGVSGRVAAALGLIPGGFLAKKFVGWARGAKRAAAAADDVADVERLASVPVELPKVAGAPNIAPPNAFHRLEHRSLQSPSDISKLAA